MKNFLYLILIIFSSLKSSDKNQDLITAATNGQNNYVEWLLQNGANVNFLFGTDTPLICAIREGRFETIKILVEAGAKIENIDQAIRHLIFSGNENTWDILEYFNIDSKIDLKPEKLEKKQKEDATCVIL